MLTIALYLCFAFNGSFLFANFFQLKPKLLYKYGGLSVRTFLNVAFVNVVHSCFKYRHRVSSNKLKVKNNFAHFCMYKKNKYNQNAY